MAKTLIISIMILLALILIALALFLIRLINPIEIDDISPEIPCSEDLLKKSSTLWIIPKYNNKSIAENKEWCSYISNLSKTLGLHGIYHTYQEFGTKRDQEYLQEGIDIFEQCFNLKPSKFKPPQLKISNENKDLIKSNNLILKNYLTHITHRTYHCNDTGVIPNKVIDNF